MAWNDYFVGKTLVSFPSMDILFANLTDKFTGDSLPSTFESVPSVRIYGSYQETGCYISVKSITGFTANIKGKRDVAGSYYFNFKIRGET